MTVLLLPGASCPINHLDLGDRFDVHEVGTFRDWVARASGPVVLDLGDVRFIDGAGLHALLEARATLIDRGSELWISALSQSAQITLEMADLQEAFPLLGETDEVAA